jgi:hypothetical protein
LTSIVPVWVTVTGFWLVAVSASWLAEVLLITVPELGMPAPPIALLDSSETIR